MYVIQQKIYTINKSWNVLMILRFFFVQGALARTSIGIDRAKYKNIVTSNFTDTIIIAKIRVYYNIGHKKLLTVGALHNVRVASHSLSMFAWHFCTHIHTLHYRVLRAKLPGRPLLPVPETNQIYISINYS